MTTPPESTPLDGYGGYIIQESGERIFIKIVGAGFLCARKDISPGGGRRPEIKEREKETHKQ